MKKSFTLIEILVVIVVVGILSGFIIVGTGKILKDARDAKRKAELIKLKDDILFESFKMGIGGYPTTPIQGSLGYANSGRVACCLGTGDTNCSAIESSLGESIPKDPSFRLGNKEWCYFYKSDGITFDLYAKLENNGAVSFSESTTNLVRENADCGTGWINTGLGFCVMKYETKIQGNDNGVQTYSASFVPESRATGTPWVNLSQVQAAEECKSIGAHLLNNAEWMAIARDAESVSSNWNGGVMYRGHSDANPAAALADTSSGTDPYNGTGNSSPSEQRRTLILSNGQTIWDFSGNVWEWIDYSILTTEMPAPTGCFLEFNQITNWGTNLGYENVGPKTKSLIGSNGVGRICVNSGTSVSNKTPYDNAVYGLVRGGGYSDGGDGMYPGAFSLSLYYSPAGTRVDYGFRCTK